MTNNWKNFKDNIIGKKGLLSIGFADIVGSAISGLFWLYIASQLNPEIYGELIYFISIAGLAQMVSLFGSSNALTVYTANEIATANMLITNNVD